MSYEAFTSTPVIIAAFTALLVGVVGTKAWGWLGDWRQARMIGTSLFDFRRLNQRRLGVVALVRRREARLGEPVALASAIESSVSRSSVRVTDAGTRVSGANSEESSVPAVMSQQSVPVAPLSFATENLNRIKRPCESSASIKQRPARVIVAAADQMRDFIVFELGRAGGHSVKREYTAWYDAYLKWAAVRAIDPVPQSIFLKLLGKTSGVEKTITRLKDPLTGRVVKNEAGTPVRIYSYILGEPIAETRRGKGETRRQRINSEIAEMAERRRLVALTPDQSWPEFLASMPEQERARSGLEDLYRKIAA